VSQSSAAQLPNPRERWLGSVRANLRCTFKRYLVISALVLCSAPAKATTQIPDEIVIDGRPLPLFSDPIAALYPA